MKRTLLLATLSLGSLYAGAQNIIYVSSTGSDTNDGLSWAKAKATVQAAVNQASANDQIWIAKGTFYPTSFLPGFTEGTKGKAILPKPGVGLYGGFAGTETELSQRPQTDLDNNGTIEPWEFVNTTILSADTDGVEDKWEYNATDRQWSITGNAGNCYHVIYYKDAIGGTEVITLNGLTISGGNADGTNDHMNGGGIFAESDIVTIQGCIIKHNYASNEGGGLYSLAQLKESLITENATNALGGGLSNYNTVNSCHITRNTSANMGGGVYNSGYVIKSKIYDNSGLYGGGIYNAAYLQQSFIFNNYAERVGSGVYNAEGTGQIENSVINNNLSVNSQGVYNDGNSIVYCTIANNANTAGSAPDGLINSAGSVVNSILWNNSYAVSGAEAGTITYSAFTSTEPTGEGNILLNVTDPNFVRPTLFKGEATSGIDSASLFTADWQLTADSKCIGSGKVLARPTVDITGNRRSDKSADMGAYLYIAPSSSSTITNQEAACFPNPFRSAIHIISEDPVVNVTVSALNGTLIYVASPDETARKIINTEGIEKGIYIISVQTTNKQFVRKMMK
ncbi:MAG: T9SS type A sorting domain-containing protein [Bacteroidales bacterium]